VSAACDAALTMRRGNRAWLLQSDAALADLSWDRTAARMQSLIEDAIMANAKVVTMAAPAVRAAGRRKPFDCLVVGGGFAGSVLAERLAASGGKRVLVIDRRPHIAGNAYDHKDEAGVLIHRYGPHIFHTNSPAIVDYLSRFTEWRPYEHRVLASVGDHLMPMPINRTTLNILYGLDLKTEAEAEAFLASRAEPVDIVRTSRDVVISAIGRELYETFFEGYTRKQWGLDPSELDKAVTSRVPTRTNTDDRYFTDSFQAMPAAGYTAMFERMLDHPNIETMLGVDYEDVKNDLVHDHLFYTGPIDEYFGYRFGRLPYRSLRFQHETLDQTWLQSVAVVNYPSENIPYTRITEYKHLTGQQHAKTSITYEFPCADGDPYYPVPRPENQALYKKYEALALETPGVTFAGRLGTYRYYNMDQVVGQALATARRFLERGQSAGDSVAQNATLPA
jgi:UDP-galactopyranose mutase